MVAVSPHVISTVMPLTSVNFDGTLVVTPEKENFLMHCPQCGQQLASDKIRFCTRCGFALNDFKELLVPNSREIKEKGKSGKGVRQGLALFLFGLVLISVLAILRDMDIVPQIFVKIAALVFCVGGAVRMAYPFLYGEDVSPKKKDASNDAATHILASANVTNNLLPQAQSSPIITFGARNYDTAEILQPSSVTEHTTKLLKNDQLEQK